MNNGLEELKGPATGLIIIGVANGVLALLTLLSGLVRLIGPERLPTDEAEKIGFLIATVSGYGVAFFSLVAAPLIVYGGYRMMSGKSYGFAKASAILSIIPFVSCCFIAGIPVGLWALKVLSRPEVKRLFDGDLRFTVTGPPLPPRF